MDDIFYLSTEKINLNNIKQIAEEKSANKIQFSAKMDIMDITYCDNTITSWAIMDIEEFHGSEEKNFFQDKKICAVFCISYHPANFQSLKVHLVEVLKKYGGWIGMDSDGFFPYYNLKNIEEIVW